MKATSVQRQRRNLRRFLGLAITGEEVVIAKRGEPVARLLPINRKKVADADMTPDVSGRLKKVFGKQIISDKAMKAIWGENRRDF